MMRLSSKRDTPNGYRDTLHAKIGQYQPKVVSRMGVKRDTPNPQNRRSGRFMGGVTPRDAKNHISSLVIPRVEVNRKVVSRVSRCHGGVVFGGCKATIKGAL